MFTLKNSADYRNDFFSCVVEQEVQIENRGEGGLAEILMVWCWLYLIHIPYLYISVFSKKKIKSSWLVVQKMVNCWKNVYKVFAHSFCVI